MKPSKLTARPEMASSDVTIADMEAVHQLRDGEEMTLCGLGEHNTPVGLVINVTDDECVCEVPCVPVTCPVCRALMSGKVN